ncbi:MAG: hypothetical protein LBG24_12230 [Treponema sp.]|nr:hypothetical protein [Treponema sp.]
MSLCNALSGADYGDDTPVFINTRPETMFSNRKNDLSGIINDEAVIVTEHQSTINENMPFRFLSSIARLFENSISDRNLIYRRRLVKLPRPEFFVLYNGIDPYPDKVALKLSEAFKQAGGMNGIHLELLVTMINVNKGRNGEIIKRCETLSGYAEFVDQVRKKQGQLIEENPEEKPYALQKALRYAITYCREQGILEWFFKNLTREEENMLITEWNQDEALKVRFEEGLEQGREEARHRASTKTSVAA